MKYNELTLKRNTKPTRKGRGISAGKGMTAGRGTKGQGSRKSGGVRPGFEGGQMPLYMRLPKLRGFKSKKASTEVVYTAQLESLKLVKIDNLVLAESGLVSSPNTKVKLVVKGELRSRKEIKIQAASAKAVAMVEKAGGSFIPVEQQPRIAKKASEESPKKT